MNKRLFLLLAVFTMKVSGIFSQIHSNKYNEATNVINWPTEFNPKKSKLYVYGEIEIYASPEVIWDILIDAEKWPEWYVGAKEVKVLDSAFRKLKLHSSFSWQTMGFKFTSVIKEFIPNSRLSWQSFKKGIPGYHAWVIIPIANGCRVITAESQNGWITIPEKIFQPKKLMKLHDVWLLEIKKKAEIKSQVSPPSISNPVSSFNF